MTKSDRDVLKTRHLMDIYHTSVTFMDFFDRGVCTNPDLVYVLGIQTDE